MVSTLTPLSGCPKDGDHLCPGMEIPSTSLIPENDPSLLFVNSGMAPLKPYFLGEQSPPSRRLCNVQRCIRTTDVESVGDRHHLTLFEMMGSWSIGDYWKTRAIELACDLLVNRFGFDLDKLYATIYSGDEAQSIALDHESIDAWKAVGMSADHIVPLGEDNFWGPAGDTGPCGPCTEIFFDTGIEHGPEYVPGGEFDTQNRYIEVWNAGVFMEYNLSAVGLSALEVRSVDTGSGVERMAMVLNECQSVYDTPSLREITKCARQFLNSDDSNSERQARILADHWRAAVYAVAEGAIPSNTGRGYIPRRLIRRAAAIASANGRRELEAEAVVDIIRSSDSGRLNVLLRNREAFVIDCLREEQQGFSAVLLRGMDQLERMVSGDTLRDRQETTDQFLRDPMG